MKNNKAANPGLLIYDFPTNEFSILFKTYIFAVVSLPILGMVFAIVWSMVFDPDRSTSTACQVYNYLPSVSAAIALTPQAYVWRVCISIHTLPRYVILYGYWVWYSKQSYKKKSFCLVCKILAVSANFIELAALLGLTVISSRENGEVHETCFIIFMVSSLVCMVFTCILSLMIVPKTIKAKESTRRKLIAVFVNVVSFAISLYYYFRHNSHCEPGVYSLFALFEYIVILSNMAFHYTAALDFSDHMFCFQSKEQLNKPTLLSQSKENCAVTLSRQALYMLTICVELEYFLSVIWVSDKVLVLLAGASLFILTKLHFIPATRYIASLPIFGLLFAVLWSVIFDFKHSTATHCHVSNYLPSVSAAISDPPKSYIWRVCITLHSAPRYLLTFCYWKWYYHHSYLETSLFYTYVKPLRLTAFASNMLELSALLGLSLVSSKENFAIHEACFVLFVVSSLIYMLSTCLLNYALIKETEYERISARRKLIAFRVNVASLVLALYFYYRHNAYCEPGVYTLFALFEYAVIASNVVFHYTAALDYDGYSLCVVDIEGNRKL